MQDVAKRAKEKRLSQNLTQAGLAARSGVSLGSLKRFERNGDISFKSLVEIAVALGCADDFEKIFDDSPSLGSLFNVKEQKHRKRGTIK